MEVQLVFIGTSTPQASQAGRTSLPTPVFADPDGNTYMLVECEGQPALSPFPPDPSHPTWEAASVHSDARFVAVPESESPAPKRADGGALADMIAAIVQNTPNPDDLVALAGVVGGPVGAALAAGALQPSAMERSLACIHSALDHQRVRGDIYRALSTEARTLPNITTGTPPVVGDLLRRGREQFNEMCRRSGLSRGDVA